MLPRYDVIVLGVGGMGSSALFELARRGQRVLGLEQFPLVHSHGSSHGHTRVIRQAYYEHPDYVPLLKGAYDRWYDLEQRTGRHLFTACGVLNIGTATGELIDGVRTSAKQHHLDVEEFTATELTNRFSAFRFKDQNMVGILERNAGYLFVEECVRAYCDSAVSLGAEIYAEEPVITWKAVADGVEVRTTKAIYTAKKLVITAGAWATQLLADMGLPLTVMRQVMHWFLPQNPAQFRRDRFPVYLIDGPTGVFYGTPMIDPRGIKTAQHYAAPEVSTPDQVDWTIHENDSQTTRKFLEEYLPSAAGDCTTSQVCQYTLTPDRHFVIDTHPQYPQVAVAAGFSGHGFKFASVVGEILADLVLTGKTPWPIEMFRSTRFG